MIGKKTKKACLIGSAFLLIFSLVMNLPGCEGAGWETAPAASDGTQMTAEPAEPDSGRTEPEESTLLPAESTSEPPHDDTDAPDPLQKDPIPQGRFIRYEVTQTAEGGAEADRILLFLDGNGGIVMVSGHSALVSFHTGLYFGSGYFLPLSAEYLVGTCCVGEKGLEAVFSFRIPADGGDGERVSEARTFPGAYREINGERVFCPDGFERDDAHSQSGTIPAAERSGSSAAYGEGSYCRLCGEVLTEQPVIHSEYYLTGKEYSATEIAAFFSEVVLSSEYGSASSFDHVHKWTGPVVYRIFGGHTAEDESDIAAFSALVSSVPGFPGMRPAAENEKAVLEIYFCTDAEFAERCGEAINGEKADGAATAWFNSGTSIILSARVCLRNEMNPSVRRSVIWEELYNSLGFFNDTVTRPDSIIYQYSSEAEQLSDVDLLLLRLLYAGDMKPGMDGTAVKKIIEELYY